MPELKPVSSLDVCELLRRYRRDLSMRSFPCNDEGDWNLRWTRQEIGRVDRAFSTLQQAELSIPADQVLVPRRLLEDIEKTWRIPHPQARELNERAELAIAEGLHELRALLQP